MSNNMNNLSNQNKVISQRNSQTFYHRNNLSNQNKVISQRNSRISNNINNLSHHSNHQIQNKIIRLSRTSNRISKKSLTRSGSNQKMRISYQSITKNNQSSNSYLQDSQKNYSSNKNNSKYSNKKDNDENQNLQKILKNKQKIENTINKYKNINQYDTLSKNQLNDHKKKQNRSSYEALYQKERSEKEKLKKRLDELNEKVNKFEREKDLLIDNYETILTKIDTLRNLDNEASKIDLKREKMEDEISQLRETISIVREGKSASISINLNSNKKKINEVQNLFKTTRKSFTINQPRRRSVKKNRNNSGNNFIIHQRRPLSVYNYKSKKQRKSHIKLDNYFITESVKKVTVGDEIIYNRILNKSIGKNKRYIGNQCY